MNPPLLPLYFYFFVVVQMLLHSCQICCCSVWIDKSKPDPMDLTIHREHFMCDITWTNTLIFIFSLHFL